LGCGFVITLIVKDPIQARLGACIDGHTRNGLKESPRKNQITDPTSPSILRKVEVHV